MEDALITSIRLSDHKVLTRGQEHALALRVVAGEPGAREELILCNQRLVYSIARPYLRRSNLPFVDLIQAGNLGLIRAVEKFDPTLGYKLSTYATWWIKQAIDIHIAQDHQLPKNVWEIVKRLRQAQLLHPDSTDSELAEIADVPIHKVRPILDFAEDRTSLDLTPDWNDDGGSGPSSPTLIDSTDVEREAVHGVQLEQIRSSLDSLSPNHRRAVELRYGLDDGPEHTLQQIGDELGVTREWARMLILQAITSIRRDIAA